MDTSGFAISMAKQVSMINKYNNFIASKKVLCIATKYLFYRRDKQNLFQAKFVFYSSFFSLFR